MKQVFETDIGLEIHAELNTKTKAFCACKVGFGGKENTRCCPVCMGFPGTLSCLNGEMVKKAVKMGLALNCSINPVIKNARKNYFYPDLPKGYQISQGDLPVCKDGYHILNGRRIRINRIHIEEDAGKLIHEGDKTLIDYNRAGVPLIEIVTEPDLRSAAEAKQFLEEIRDILKHLDISDCKMQEGSLRCDVNVSVRKEGQKEYNERCEIKNVNSFSFVENCIESERERQLGILSKGGKVTKETRRWDDVKNESIVLRTKENDEDYRYFPEPDIPFIKLEEEFINSVKNSMPLLPKEKVENYVKEYNLSQIDAKNIVKKKSFITIFEDAIAFGANPKNVANRLLGDVSAFLNENGEEEIKLSGKDVAKLLKKLENGEISSTAVREILEIMLKGETVKEENFTQINDENILTEIVNEVISCNEKSVSDYKRGKKNAIGHLVGQCMKKSGGKANPELLKKILEEKL